MITRFEAHNFKSIKALSLPMQQFMVLVGPNGAGKTNVVRGLELFGEIIWRGTIDPVREQGYDQLIRREKKPARAGISFAITMDIPEQHFKRELAIASSILRLNKKFVDMPGSLSVEAGVSIQGSINSADVRLISEDLRFRQGDSELYICSGEDGISVELRGDARLGLLFSFQLVRSKDSEQALASPAHMQSVLMQVLERPRLGDETEQTVLNLLNWQRTSSIWLRYLRDHSRVTRLRLDASALRSDSRFEESRDRILGPNGEGLAAAIEKLRGQGSTPKAPFRKILKALQQVYPRVEDVIPERVQPGRLMLSFKEHGISEKLGQSNVSDGVMHALALLVALEGGIDLGVLAIEEPENAIHPWSLRAMIERAQEMPSRQIILTTHSETLVNAVKDTRSLLIVENDEQRGTTVTSASEKEEAIDSILKESGQKLGEVWIGGTLGGVPRGEE